MIRALLDPSPDMQIAKRLVDRYGVDGARTMVRTLCAGMSNVEKSALAMHWPFWARPKQIPPAEWRSWGNLTSRGWGKSLTCAKLITSEIQAGRARTLIMSAQNLTKTEAVQVEGLIAAAPPWFRPTYRASSFVLEWPNGARAFAYTPEVPETIRSENADLAWLSELQSWPKATREEAYSNFVFATRVRGARTLWDATPKKAHPILKRLLARAEKNPTKHFVVRGSIFENPHIERAALEDMLEEYGDTQKGKEELLGEMLGDEDAIFRQAWFDKSRRGLPDRLKRRARFIDPAITSDPRHSDSTGIVDMGLGLDDQVYVLANESGKHRAETWAQAAVDAYVRQDMDLLWVETNRGGDSHAALLRVVARAKGLELRELTKDEAPVRRPGIVNFRGVNTKRQKAARAEGAAALCEKGRVTFLVGALGDLEEHLCSFDGSEGSADDDIDAFVHGCHELAGLASDKQDAGAAFVGLTEVAAQVTNVTRAPGNLASLLGGLGGGGRI
ncbi:MAG TPA: terminase family protein [Gemmatimonadaceae bacterium]|nr:terminase family protein [Gemmatimonadaceae bacterium]